MALKRMDNVGIVVESLDAAISFFAELGLELEGRAMVEGEWAGRVTGLGDQRVEIAMMRTPDGHSRLELSRFITPPVVADHRNAPVNALGYLRVMFTVEDIDEMLARLRKRGAQLVGSEVVQYQDAYRRATSADLKDFSSGWPKNSAESPQFHVDRGWTSRGHGRKIGTEVGNLADFDLLVRQTPLCADCVQMHAVQARHAAPLLPATPAANILGVDAAYVVIIDLLIS